MAVVCGGFVVTKFKSGTTHVLRLSEVGFGKILLDIDAMRTIEGHGTIGESAKVSIISYGVSFEDDLCNLGSSSLSGAFVVVHGVFGVAEVRANKTGHWLEGNIACATWDTNSPSVRGADLNGRLKTTRM